MIKALLLLPIIVCFVEAYPTFQPLIPNGVNVPNPCEPNTTWPGVGHKLVGGTGDRNPFGLAFANNGFVSIYTHTHINKYVCVCMCVCVCVCLYINNLYRQNQVDSRNYLYILLR